jgi:phospholipid/cholesterol/gamma-HCH transport system substrate-binding protein
VQKRLIEILVGLFMIAGVAALATLALKVSGLTQAVSGKTYVLIAEFDTIGGLRVRSPVRVAGVRVGEVTAITLDPKTYRAKVDLTVMAEQKFPQDTSASILTEGLLGSNYISLAPGFDETNLQNGNTIQTTHSAIILENLIGSLLFSVKDKK